jgi:hypothetical protein
VGRDREGARPQLLRGLHRRGTPDHSAAAAAGAAAHRCRIGVTLHDAHVVHVDAQLVGHHLRDRGLQALAVTTRAGEHVDLAVVADAHRRGVARHVPERGRRGLGEQADADPDEAAFLASGAAAPAARSVALPPPARGSSTAVIWSYTMPLGNV